MQKYFIMRCNALLLPGIYFLIPAMNSLVFAFNRIVLSTGISGFDEEDKTILASLIDQNRKKALAKLFNHF